MFGFGFGSVWVWVVSKNRSLVWFGSKFFVMGLVRFGLHFENLVRFGSQNCELAATLINISKDKDGLLVTLSRMNEEEREKFNDGVKLVKKYKRKQQ